MKIRLAKTEDITAILRIIDQAKAYLHRQQIDQWQDGYPNQASILADITRNVSYVLCDEDKIVATAAILFEDDPNYRQIEDGSWLSSGPYGVLHRVACDEQYKGHGYSGLIFDYAKKQAEKLGMKSMRIDTHEKNHSMQRLIAKHGFQYCGIVYMADGGKRLAYERPQSRSS